MTLLTADFMFHVLSTNWNLATYCLILWFTVSVRQSVD